MLGTAPGMDSSDDVDMLLSTQGNNGLRRKSREVRLGDASEDFTFGPRATLPGAGVLRDPRKRAGATALGQETLASSSSSSSSASSSQRRLKDEDELLQNLRGSSIQIEGRLRNLDPVDSPLAAALNQQVAGGTTTPFDSPFASSTKPQRRKGAGTVWMPSTPTGARGAGRSSALGFNQDGSFSVVRDEDEANNSGLLDIGSLGPMLGTRDSDLFAFRHGGGRLKNGTPSVKRSAMRNWGKDGAGHRASSPSLDADNVTASKQNVHGHRNDVDASIVEHSLSKVPEADEGEEGDDHSQLLAKLRFWRQDAMEHHLFETAAFWGEKILWIECEWPEKVQDAASRDAGGPKLTIFVFFLTAAGDENQRSNDAYFLAKAYFLTHQYSRAEQLLTVPLPRMARAVRKGAQDDSAPFPAQSGSDFAAEDDALEAALLSTRKNSILPAVLFEGDDAKAGVSAGLAFAQHTRMNEFKTPLMSEELAAGLRKRKDRDFTVSGTGTGSESNDGAESDGKTSSRHSPIDVEQSAQDSLEGKCSEARPGGTSSTTFAPRDFRSGARDKPPSAQDDRSDLPIPGQLYTAWKEEQNKSLREVQEAGHLRKDSHTERKALVDSSTACRFLAAKCLTRLGKLGQALDLIGEHSGRWQGGGRYGFSSPSSDGLLKVSSSVCHLRGLIHLRMDNLEQAREAFIEALRLDVKNYDAFSCLVQSRLLDSSQELWSLIEGLQWQAQSAGDTSTFEFIKMCYTARLDKESHEDAVRAAAARRALWNEFPTLQSSTDLLLSLAEDLYSRRRYKDAFTVTSRIMSLDADDEQTLNIHVSCIASSSALRRSERPKLFLLANRLVEEHPDKASSWYAVGVWYVISEKWTEARRYFSKATLLNPRHLPSWLCFAHSFSLEGESEQAVLAYSSVVRNFPQLAHARLCLGSEHLRMGNLHLARLFLESKSLASVYSEGDEERGILCYLEGRTDEAILYLERSLRASAAIDEPQSGTLTIQLNLAWAYYKADRLESALRLFSKAISLDPTNAPACLGMGMTRHRQGQLSEAVGWYHETLSIEPTHAQATELLQFAIDEYAQTSSLQNLDRSSLDVPPEQNPLSESVPGAVDPASGIGRAVGDLSLGNTNQQYLHSEGTSSSQHHLGVSTEQEEVSASMTGSHDSGMMMETRIEASQRGLSTALSREDQDESNLREEYSIEMDETE